ncbi:beta-ketoacyl synthase N-terminal-like domain-containing protein [Streptomyces sp. B1866]|uniref:beta-ketoacyl synthase N-terminal-like domain-containing protein n=1 Tax=Streptomyces sp. B1866 TaxID=3075431 RepID=UPI002891444B|nr:beta-ketoacyl synthase N-terminal-like domain-containing protein [Streptomyces sp. B1866]MDT3399155.1 beta-ketoacyl synthase N-terminal-like domain-containing protein [Streptomyces sp. B1866]
MVFATDSGGPLISAWAAVSPWGLSGADFASGLASGRPAGTPLDPEEWSVPYRSACLVPGFEIKQALGRKGTRSLDRATGLALSALCQLLGTGGPASGNGSGGPDGGERLPGVGEDTGLALGTSAGSVQSIMDFTRDSLVGERPFFVDPARFPGTVMNFAAGQAAIWHRLKGPNTTIAGGRATGLLALQYALRLQRAGRAAAVLCGAVEEFSSARAWLEWHARDADDEQSTGGADGTAAREADAAVLGEGAAVWLLEPAAAARAHGRGIAEVAGVEFGFAAEPGDVRPVLAEVLGRLLARTGTDPAAVWAVADSGEPGARGRAERAALADALGGREPARVTPAACIGDTCAASAAFQVAAVLALAERGDAAPGSPALVTTVDRDGVVGAALLRTVAGRP